MLDGLDGIDWARVEHAYGSATDVPHLLRQLISDDEEARCDAFGELCSNIWQQGTVYEATALAVPFLLQLVAASSTPGRDSITFLLGWIAGGNSYHAVYAPWKTKDVAREQEWVTAARAAVGDGLETLLSLLAESDRRLRLAAVTVAARLPEHASRIRPVLERILDREQDENARAAIGLALALVGGLRLDAFNAVGTSKTRYQRLAMIARTATVHAPKQAVFDLLLHLAQGTFDDARLDDADVLNRQPPEQSPGSVND